MVKVLVVDDEPAILRALRAGLAARGDEVLLATTGQEAIDVTALENPDVVVLDLGLPDIDGVDVCRRIREWSTVPIVVLSANTAPQDRAASAAAGADGHIGKPIKIEELISALDAAVPAQVAHAS